MNKTTLIMALGVISGLTLSAQPEGYGPRDDRPPLEEVAATLLTDFDADSSGGLSLIEFEEAMKAHREQIREHRMEMRGDEGDARIDHPMPERGAAFQEHMKERLSAAFTTADADGNGSLDAAELVEAMKAMRPGRRGDRQGPMPE